MSIDGTLNEAKIKKRSAGNILIVDDDHDILESHKDMLTIEGGYNNGFSASIGIANYPEDGMDANALLRDADTAMYKTNNIGKNYFQFFAPE